MSSMLEPNLHPGTFAGVDPRTRSLSANPTLPQHPLGAYTDATYEAELAQLRSDTSRKYADILKQLGFMDQATGQFIPGSVETMAWKEKLAQQRSMRLAEEGVTNEAQRGGTLFSGLRADNTAKAQHPFVQAIADIDTQVPLTLMDLYGQAGSLMEDYQLGQNRYLASAASRRAADLATQAPPDYEEPGVDEGVAPAPAAALRTVPSYPVYNPAGYVPGGATPRVAKAIVKKATPPPAYNPNAYVRGGAPIKVAKAIQAQGWNR